LKKLLLMAVFNRYRRIGLLKGGLTKYPCACDRHQSARQDERLESSQLTLESATG
jgi:hypothetical protein